MRPSHLLRENIKKNKVGQLIEKQTPMWPRPEFGSNRYYHPYTRGWILNEIFRRVDPQRRTIGEYVKEQITKPLGGGIYFGERLTKVQDLNELNDVITINSHTVPGLKKTKLEVLYPL